MPLRWTKALAVGIDSIDEQHRELFRRASGFLEGLDARSRQDVGILLSYLRAYALVHFGDEEEVMRSARYPGYDRHKAQHDGFLRDLMAFSTDQERRRGPGVAPHALGSWMAEWLLQHVSRTDRDLATFLLARRAMAKADR